MGDQPTDLWRNKIRAKYKGKHENMLKFLKTSPPKASIMSKEAVKEKSVKIPAEDKKPKGKMESLESDLSDWECRTFGNIQLKSPPMVHYDDDLSGSDNPHLSPRRKLDKQNDDVNRMENIPTKWNNSLTSRDRDSGLGGSLISAYGSVLTDSSSSFDGQSNSESETVSNVSSPAQSTYGRYRKIYGSSSDSADKLSENETEEVVVLHRLPGENLGMILGIEGDKTKPHISTVRVKSVTIGGAAYRATGSNTGISVSDEILEVNGLVLKTLSHDECVTVFKEMPLRVILKIRRKSKRKKNGIVSSEDERVVQNGFVKRYSVSESEDDVREGFVPLTFEIDKDPKESLGLSIVPSYGSTRQYFQVKRLLPSGAASRSRKLKVGDRLVSCNGIDLQGINQSKCLSILKSEANNGDFEIGILRPVENDVPTEFSLTVTNARNGETNLILRSPKFSRKLEDNPFDTESEPEVTLNSFQNFDHLFASNTLKLSHSKPPHKNSHSSDLSSDLDSSFDQRDFTKSRRNNTKMSGGDDPWSFAFPPPAEFSDTPDNDLHGEIPDTSIHDVLNDYSPASSNMSTPIHQPSAQPDMKMIEALVGLEDDHNVSGEFPLTEIEEENTSEQENHLGEENSRDNDFEQSNQMGLVKEDEGMDYKNSNGDYKSQHADDIDSKWLPEQNDIELNNDIDSSDVDTTYKKKNKNYFGLVGKIHQFYYNSSDTFTQSESEADDMIQPVTIKKEFSVPEYLKEPTTTVISIAEEETIQPATVQRENIIPVSARFDVNSFVDVVQKDEKVEDFPQPAKSKSPPLPNMKREKSPKKNIPINAEFNGDEVVETFVPVQTTKADHSKILEEKLGKGIEEETVIRSEVKRDNSFGDSVQLLMMTNKWTNSAKNNNMDKNSEMTLSGVVGNLKKAETVKEQYSTGNINGKMFDGNEVLNKNEQKTDPFENEISNSNDREVNQERELDRPIGEYKTEISVTNNNIQRTDNKVEEFSSVPAEETNTSEIGKPTIINLEDTSSTKLDKEKLDKSVHKTTVDVTSNQNSPDDTTSKLEEEKLPVHKTTVSVASAQNSVDKTSVSVASTQSNADKTTVSVASTQNSTETTTTSPTIKPLTAIKPLSFNSLSLNRPNKYKSVIDTGSKPSLLSTIYSKTHTVAANVRSESEDFQVSVMKGILGIGMKVEVEPEGYVRVTEIQPSGPVGKDGNIRVGDYIISINSTEVTGLPDHKVQQIIRLLPRGLAKIVVSVTPPDVSKADLSKSRPSDLSIGSSVGSPRRLTPALGPRSFDRVTSPSSSTPSPSGKSTFTITKPLSTALSPTSNQGTLSSPPAGQHSPSAGPRSPGLSPALAPRKSPQTPPSPKPVATPRQNISHYAKESDSNKPTASPGLPVEEGMTIVKVTSTRKEPPPVAPKPKPRPLPQQTETATHHKITPNFGGYVGSAVGQLKKSSEPTQSHKEPVITPQHTDYVASAQRAGHDEADKGPIDTVIFTSISSNKKTDYVSSARKTDEPKIIPPSGIVDFVSKEQPKVAERTKPAHFQVLPQTVSGEGGVKIASVRLNSALSPRKTKSPDKVNTSSFNFNANYSYEEKALPRAGYFVGKTDVVTPSVESGPLHDEDVSIPPVPSPRSEKDQHESPRSNASDAQKSPLDDDTPRSPPNSPALSPRSATSTSSQIDVVACTQDSLNTSSDLSHEIENMPSPRPESEISECSLDSSQSDKQLGDAFGVGLEAKIVSEVSVGQESIHSDNTQIDLHGETNNLYMHENINNTNNDQCDFNEQTEDSNSGELTQNISIDTDDFDTSMTSNIQEACSNVVVDTSSLSGEGMNTKGESSNQNSDVQLMSDSELISFDQEQQGSDDSAMLAEVEDVDIVNNVCNVPDGFGDDVDMKVDSVESPPQQIDNETSTISDSARTSVPLPSYCIKFPPVDNFDSIFVASQRPFSVVCGSQNISVHSKSNSLDEIPMCTLLISTQMLSDDLKLANQRMDSLGRSESDVISVILFERESSRIPIGLSLQQAETGEDLVISRIDSTSLFRASKNVKTGDTILLMNGEIVNKDNSDAILQSMESSESHLVCLVTSPCSSTWSKKDNSNTTSSAVDSPTSDENANKKIVPDVEEPTSPSVDSIIELTMVKGVTGLGFLIEGGLGSPRGDVPVKIKRMFKGGAAAKCGLLQVGDELVKVNGKEMASMKHTEAWNYLKFLEDGAVKVVVRRVPE